MRSGLFLSLLSLVILGMLSFQSDFDASKKRGEEVYMGYCVSCHMADGKGIQGVFPPLAEADYLMEDKKRSIDAVKNGLEGKIVVNGIEYNNIMTPLGLSDQEIADVLNFVRNSWGNEGEMIEIQEISSE
ncbi:MAG: cytochrome c [Cyclobacteriaceae bacterium]